MSRGWENVETHDIKNFDSHEYSEGSKEHEGENCHLKEYIYCHVWNVDGNMIEKCFW